MKVSVTKIFEFEAAHRLPDYDGACKNLHGHSYKLEVEVSGYTDKVTGMIIDFKIFKKIVEDAVLYKYDHSNLNDFFSMPTAENMVVSIAKNLSEIINFIQPGKPSKGFSGMSVVRVRLWETSTSYAEVKLC